MWWNRHDEKVNSKAEIVSSGGGYTLIEVLITMFILGMIILVVNVVFVALVRVSYEVDVRMKVRQGMEFALEVIRRNTKSAKVDEISIVANPLNGVEGEDCDAPGALDAFPVECTLFYKALKLKIAETSQYVTFYVTIEGAEYEDDGDVIDPGVAVLKALWRGSSGPHSYTWLTSDEEIDVKAFDPVVQIISETGGTEIIINLTASSVQMETDTEAVVDNVTKQDVIITRHQQL